MYILTIWQCYNYTHHEFPVGVFNINVCKSVFFMLYYFAWNTEIIIPHWYTSSILVICSCFMHILVKRTRLYISHTYTQVAKSQLHSTLVLYPEVKFITQRTSPKANFQLRPEVVLTHWPVRPTAHLHYQDRWLKW